LKEENSLSPHSYHSWKHARKMEPARARKIEPL
jgi:hypothetical protein